MHSRTISIQSIDEDVTMGHNDNDVDVEKMMYNKNDDRSVGRRRITVKCADAVLDWFVFPFLLFIQFGTTMYCQQQQDPT